MSSILHRRIATPLSLERKLPVLMTGVLVVVLVASLLLTHRTLTWSAEGAALERLERAAREVATTVERAVQQRAAALRRTARDSAIRRIVTLPVSDPPFDDEAAPSVLARFHNQADSALALELWNARGDRVAFIGPNLPAAERAHAPRPGYLSGTTPDGVTDSVTFGSMYASAGQVYFWIVAPIIERGRPVGYIAQQRRVTGPREAPQSLRGLIGEDVELYLRNATGPLWASSSGSPATAPQRPTYSRDDFAYREDVGRLVAAEQPIAGAPWMAVLETPLRSVHARSRTVLAPLVLVSVLLIIAGAALSWLISRRITRPLASLTEAAAAMSRGDYGRRVVSAADDEIGRLAASFNQMATEVAASRVELERQIEDAHAARGELELANSQLQQAIGEADQAREEAERANRAKSDFLAVMSHELRTPLNAIGGYAQLIDLGIYGPVTQEQRDALARIARSQVHLIRLISDVLNFTRIDAGQVQYATEDVSAEDALVSVESMIAPQVRVKGLSFICHPGDPLLVVRADREKLLQIVLNLLTNAIKFTPEGGHVEIDTAADGAWVRLHVRDSGVGISPERIPHIFEPFVQVDRALNRPNEGVGLGLSISRDLARGMGGDIGVRSVVGRGSEFTVILPRGRLPSAPDLPHEGVARPARAPTLNGS